MGFDLSGHKSHYTPFDLSTRVAKPQRFRELEDYVMENQFLQWFDDLPAREERLAQLAHPFYGIAVESGSIQATFLL